MVWHPAPEGIFVLTACDYMLSLEVPECLQLANRLKTIGQNTYPGQMVVWLAPLEYPDPYTMQCQYQSIVLTIWF